MRRNARRRENKSKLIADKILIYASIAVAIISLVLIGLFLYSRNLKESARKSTMTLDKMANIANNTSNNTSKEETKSASTDIGKTVEEVEKQNTVTNTTANTANSSNTASATNTKTKAVTENKTNSAKTTNTKQEVEPKKELSFCKPVEGEIVREFAKDNLVYSNTLEEWVTHLGIDIKADKTTVVKSAEEGTVKSIKNDPRYGLTIVIEHADGYQTVYANLLSSEFVVEGEKVKKEQTIGTVGNTAAFESVDEPHLHFEILKDSIQLDPNIYIK